MTTTLTDAQLVPAALLPGSPEESTIVSQVRLVLSNPFPERNLTERRREKRHPYPYPIYLTPVCRDGKTPEGKTVVVVGKHLSEHGLDFYHREPLPYRRVIASLACGSGAWVGLLMDLSWCRFCRHGWYDNGGRFLSAVPSPLEDPAERQLLDL
ncbi:MAG TPA: hypothetical protein VL096_05725 [Pirellulaceae bacterium]|nr:hypothetical protein [Pirellulaceae bacterium]